MKLARPIRYTVDGAAQALGLSRRTMWRRVHEWGFTVIGDHDARGRGRTVFLLAAEVEAAATDGLDGVRKSQIQKRQANSRLK